MSSVWNSSAISAGGQRFAAIDRSLAPFVVLAAVTFNFVLCFLDTNVFNVNTSIVVSCEIVLIATAFGLIYYRENVFYAVFLVFAAYFFIVMLIRFEFEPKILRDLLIPLVFFLLGSHVGSLRWCDRLVAALIMFVLVVALFEWLGLDTYLHHFNVIQYYAARGNDIDMSGVTAHDVFIKGSDTAAGLFINGTRFGERTLLPFLGPHRVSGIFLEPVSVGNFGAIAFAWILLRKRGGFWRFFAKVIALGIILVLADARFGVYLVILTVAIYWATPLIRPTMLFVAPFIIMVALTAYGGVYGNVGWQVTPDNTMAGRLAAAGDYLASLNFWQILGLQRSEVFSSDFVGYDAGYGYLMVKVGLLGVAAIWALFVYSSPVSKDALRFKNFIAFYAMLLLTISASLFTIKTAALLWFLYGTLNNPNRAEIGDVSGNLRPAGRAAIQGL